MRNADCGLRIGADYGPGFAKSPTLHSYGDGAATEGWPVFAEGYDKAGPPSCFDPSTSLRTGALDCARDRHTQGYGGQVSRSLVNRVRLVNSQKMFGVSNAGISNSLPKATPRKTTSGPEGPPVVSLQLF